MTTQKFKSLFENRFYNQSYKRWRIDKEKAGKDIVGEQYELFREEYYKGLGFEIGDGKKIFGSSYNCDTVVERNGEIVMSILVF